MIKIKKIFKSSIIVFILLIIIFLSYFIITTFKYLSISKKYSKKYDLETSFILSIIHAESKFNKKAISKKGASGLMQLRKDTADSMAKEINLEDYDYSKIFQPEININLGTYYLKWLKNYYKNNMNLVVASYNAGLGNVNKWLDDPKYSFDSKNLRYIPFLQTRKYVKKVNYYYNIYSFILGIFKIN